MNFIYQNEATLDKKNNSTIDISEKKKILLVEMNIYFPALN